MEAVFGFNSSSVIISGGRLTSFTEIDSSTYSFKANNNLVTVTVPENSTFDVAGNPNLGTSSAQVRHCKSLSTPFTCDCPSLKWQFNRYYSMVKKSVEFLLTSMNGMQIPCLQSQWCCFALSHTISRTICSRSSQLEDPTSSRSSKATLSNPPSSPNLTSLLIGVTLVSRAASH
jgi:hypothetical protein